MNPGVRSTDMAAQSVVGIYDTMARAEEAVTRAAESVFTRARRILYEAHVPVDAVETQMTDTVHT